MYWEIQFGHPVLPWSQLFASPPESDGDQIWFSTASLFSSRFETKIQGWMKLWYPTTPKELPNIEAAWWADCLLAASCAHLQNCNPNAKVSTTTVTATKTLNLYQGDMSLNLVILRCDFLEFWNFGMVQKCDFAQGFVGSNWDYVKIYSIFQTRNWPVLHFNDNNIVPCHGNLKYGGWMNNIILCGATKSCVSVSQSESKEFTKQVLYLYLILSTDELPNVFIGISCMDFFSI